MGPMRRWNRAPLPLAWALVLACLAAPARADEAGIRLTRVDRGYEAWQVALRPGDVLREWRQGDEQGPLRSPVDLSFAAIERAPRGGVTLIGGRGQEPLTVTLVTDEWGLDSEPVLGADGAALLGELGEVGRGQRNGLGDGPRLLAATVRVARLEPPPVRAWLLGSIARLQGLAGRRLDMGATFDEARRVLREAGDAWAEPSLWSAQSHVLRAMGRGRAAAAAQREALALRRRGRPDLATAGDLLTLAALGSDGGLAPAEVRAALEEALALTERLAPSTTAHARVLERLGDDAADPAEKTTLYERALAIRERGPETLAIGYTLQQLGGSVYFSDAQKWLTYAQRGADLAERLDPDTLGHAIALNLLAAAALAVGDVPAAEAAARRSLEIRERLAPDSLDVADSLGSLSSTALARGDVMEAEVDLRRAVGITERQAPGTVMLAKELEQLGEVSRELGELAAAEKHLTRALATLERAADVRELPPCLTLLAALAQEQGDVARSEAYYRRALETARPLGPDAPLLSLLQESLGRLVAGQGRRAEAETLLREALARDQRTGDRGYGLAQRHRVLGDFLLENGALEEAQTHLQAALAFYQQLAPGSSDEASTYHALALVARKQERLEDAEALLRRGMAALEIQGRHMVRSVEARGRFRARQGGLYTALEDVLIRRGKTAEAFEVTERARAWTLLTYLAERRMAPGPAIPAELAREKRAADADYDRCLLQLKAARPEARRDQQSQVESARRRQEDVRARIRAAAPRTASFDDSAPLDVDGARRVLEPGTLLLSYWLGRDASRLYVLGPGDEGLAVFALPGEDTIRREVQAFRARIETRRTRVLQAGTRREAQALAHDLLAPAADRIARAERLLIVPDEILHLLPFAALADPSSPSAPRFLAEVKPVHVVSSMTLYAALRRPGAGPSSAPLAITGIGDPASPGPSSTLTPTLAASARRGLRLEPLPWARRELLALREVSPAATLWLGGDATEARAKSIGPGPDIVHFACHGFVDERFPLESGLVLSIPRRLRAGEDNGLLQAWEVFEGMHIDADLVTLSACRTGLGRETSGEGLLGLVWAFEYAGAHSVLASLWEVNDASTARLMRTFYRELASGTSKAEALRRAQIELLRRPATAAPFYWAAFSLIGDGH
jgi:CHAT domain-containing protein/Tfp pilus assembly protein PilF